MTAEPSVPRISREVDGESVSPELPPLLLAVYRELARQPADLSRLRGRIEELLVYLTTPSGRTNANCWAADLFFALDDGWGEVSWDHVPDELGDILGDMGGALHDSVKDPHIAENFESTPEQLLERLREVKFPDGAV